MSKLKQKGDMAYIVDENEDLQAGDYDIAHIDNSLNFIGTPCIICGETVPLTEGELHMSYVAKVCDKCKEAIMKVRKELKDDK